MPKLIGLKLASSSEIREMQATVKQFHYLHRPVDARCSIEAYAVILLLQHMDTQPVGLLMFGRPEATRCGAWYGSVEDVRAGRCEVTRWQVLNLARVWLSPDVQPGGQLYKPGVLPGYVDRRGQFRSTLASTVIKLAAQQIGYDYLRQRPPCFLDEPYEIKYLMSYCDRKVHRGIIYQQSGFELYKTNDRQIETWRLPLPTLTVQQDTVVRTASERSVRSQKYRSERLAMQMQMVMGI